VVRSVDPRTGEEFGPAFPDAGPDVVRETVNKAVFAARQMGWGEPGVLAAGLRAGARALEEDSERLVEIADRETALGSERLRGEVQRTTGQLRAFADLVDDGSHRRLVVSTLGPGGPAAEVRKVNVPLGVVAVFAASNFPFAFSVAGGDTAAALAAGCPVVVKAHPGHPQTSAKVGTLMATALDSVGLPQHTLQVVHGGVATARALVQQRDVAAVGFTGSTAGGRAISDLAAARPSPIPVYAEQGSLNPVVLAPSALAEWDQKVELFAASVSAGQGQFCTKPGIFLVPADKAPRFAEDLAGALGRSGPAFVLTAGIQRQFDDGVAAASKVPGVTVWRAERPDRGFGVAATVLHCATGELISSPELREELFGPAAVVVSVRDVRELSRALASLGGNLTGTVHGAEDDSWTEAAVAVLARHVGRLVYNGVPTGVAVVPAMHHGGPFPASNSARYTSVGLDAIDRFMRPVAYQDFPPGLLPAFAREVGPA